MAPSAIFSPSLANELEAKPAVLLETATELVSKQIHEPVEPVSFVDITYLPENMSSSSDSSPVDAAVKPLAAVNHETLPQLHRVASAVKEPMSGAKKLRKMLLETDELIVCPGVYDGLSARTAIELGFNAMYMVSLLRLPLLCVRAPRET